jgi:hypothetical protein
VIVDSGPSTPDTHQVIRDARRDRAFDEDGVPQHEYDERPDAAAVVERAGPVFGEQFQDRVPVEVFVGVGTRHVPRVGQVQLARSSATDRTKPERSRLDSTSPTVPGGLRHESAICCTHPHTILALSPIWSTTN